MPDFDIPARPSLFSRTLRECRKLYVSSGELCEREYPHLIEKGEGQFVALMDDLHRAIVLKIYLQVCEADKKWSKQERFLAEVLCHHLWGHWLSGEKLTETMKRASSESANLKWYSLVRPFDRIAPLRDRIGQLDTIVARLAHLIGRADGTLQPPEAAVIRSIQLEIDSHLKRPPLEENQPHAEADASTTQAIQEITQSASDRYHDSARNHDDDGINIARPSRGKSPTFDPQPTDKLPTSKDQPQGEKPKVTVEEALAELDKLIGLDEIKQEVRSLTNFLKIQQKRAAAGLPETDISLHMVFTGNPGTGKTTVARIVGKIYGALGVLEKGHLVETDRSGLVAEYAGQTGPKTNKKIDEAIDGILFIDEAYSLVAAKSEDPYGHEAVQALIKRAEDQRDRLVVILAGYPDEMEELLQSNPGLSSRFSRQLTFADYTSLNLSGIFGIFCRINRYELTPAARLKVIQGFTWHYGRRDRHFGNGRMARNLFEQAIRCMANRLASIGEITDEQLQLLVENDIEFEDVPPEQFLPLDADASRLHISCCQCKHDKDVPARYLGKKVVCPKCKQKFQVEWGSLVAGN